MSAIPAAAENPVRNSFGSDQKGPHRLKIPDATRHQSVTERKTELDVVIPSSVREAVAIISGIAAWNRRSILRSELLPTRIIIGNPMRYGVITSKPTVVFEYWLERDFMN